MSKRINPATHALALAAVLVLAACAAATLPGEEPGEPTPTLDQPPMTPAPGETPPAEPEPVLPGPPLEGLMVPQGTMMELIDETSALAQVGLGEVSIVRAESVTWNDASLGCPEPDMMYTQALVDGYWVVLEASGQTYDWRMSETGTPRLCPEGEGQPPSDDLNY